MLFSDLWPRSGLRRYSVSTVGLDEVMVREYIRAQEERDKYFEQMNLFER